MLNRILRRLSIERLKFSVKPEKSLRSIVNLELLTKRQQSNMQELSEAYHHYVSNISSANMAISLELAAFFYAVCEERNSKKILDLGSGFSSFVAGKYAQSNDAISCWSVDDNAGWLEKTKEYLSNHHITSNRCLLLEEFIRSNESKFDLMLLDLNFGEVRKDFIRLTVERGNSGAIILFDDAHKPDYRYEVLRQCRLLSVTLYDIKKYTNDSYGRYALLGVKK